MKQWNAIVFGTNWNKNVPATYVTCSDGKVSLSGKPWEITNDGELIIYDTSVIEANYDYNENTAPWYDSRETITGSLTIPHGTTSIGDYAFYGCENVTSINIPETVTSIGNYAFFSCFAVTEINFAGTREQWEYSVVLNRGWSEGISVNNGVISCSNGDVCINYEHDWMDATCTEPTTCAWCGFTEGDPLGHEPAEAIKENEVVADCENAGSYDSVVYCSVCGEELSRETTYVDALGHDDSGNWQYEWAGNTSYTVWKVCQRTNCNKHLYEHSHDINGSGDCGYEHEDLFTITYEHIDENYHKIVASDGHVIAEQADHVDNNEDDVCDLCLGILPKPECQHSWIDATCTEPRTCEWCGETEGEALGHDYIEYDGEAEPTCTEAGFIHYECANCGDSYDDEVAPATGHNWVVYDEDLLEFVCLNCGEHTYE